MSRERFFFYGFLASCIWCTYARCFSPLLRLNLFIRYLSRISIHRAIHLLLGKRSTVALHRSGLVSPRMMNQVTWIWPNNSKQTLVFAVLDSCLIIFFPLITQLYEISLIPLVCFGAQGDSYSPSISCSVITLDWVCDGSSHVRSFTPELFLLYAQACPSSHSIGIISPSSGAREYLVDFPGHSLVTNP
jgi:hypothetical protein